MIKDRISSLRGKTPTQFQSALCEVWVDQTVDPSTTIVHWDNPLVNDVSADKMTEGQDDQKHQQTNEV